jgi:1-acyl-sn-glycerol-3-phosphate acyltransferase
MNLRAARRAVALVSVLLLSLVRFWLLRLRGPLTLERRVLWGQSMGRMLMPALGIRYRCIGEAPRNGLLVSNHLSYLDILIYGTVLPCFFVSKAEVGRWPLFGTLARAGGTLFLDRSNRTSALSVTEQVAQRLDGPAPVLFFPEGTSTDGSHVLRFRSRLFDPAVVAGAPVTAAAIRYVIEDGTPERELCWFGDELFLPHLWKALGTAGFSAEVTFGVPKVYTDRRNAADATQAEVAAMRGERTDESSPVLAASAIVE